MTCLERLLERVGAARTRLPCRVELLFLTLFCLALIACGGGGPESTYTLTTVLPSPAIPGATVVAYGNLPADAQLNLGSDPLTATPVSGGLQFTVPEWAVAGMQTITVSAGSKLLSGVLQVVPRLDSAQLFGNTLTVTGAGWPSQSDAGTDATVTTRLELSGLSLTPTLAVGSLSAKLPASLPYGPLTLRITVNDTSSDPLTVSREAGAVSGKVLFPGAAAAGLESQAQLRAQRQVLEPNDLTALIVFADAATLARLATDSESSGSLEDAGGLATLEGREAVAETTTLPALGAARLRFASHEAARAAFDRLQHSSGVTSVEWDAPISTDGFEAVGFVPLNAAARGTTPQPSSLQAFTTPGSGQWFLPLIGIEAAWQKTHGEGVVVAVVDTGVDLQHPDLHANLLPGYDFVDDDAEPQDSAGHGSHVAGLVAADGAVTGTAPGAKVLPVRVLEGTSGGSSFTVAQGVLWAAGLLTDPPNPHPAQVINLSLGSSGYTEAVATAVERAQAAGVVVVAATGNAGGPVAYPAALPGVVSVTALAGPTLAYQPWYANKGPGTVLTAYGGDTGQDQDGDGVKDGIFSTDLGGYSLRMGTSMASPQVAGMVALALASGTPAEVARDTLASTAVDLGPLGYDPSFGYGLATGRTATGSDPRSYVVAFDASGKVIGWTLVQADGSYTLSDLPPGIPLTLRALSDEDGDLVLGEAGELVSAPQTFTASAGETSFTSDASLTLSNGAGQLVLTARR